MLFSRLVKIAKLREKSTSDHGYAEGVSETLGCAVRPSRLSANKGTGVWRGPYRGTQHPNKDKEKGKKT